MGKGHILGSAVVFSLLLVVSGFAVFAAAQASSAPSIASGSTGAIRSYGPPQYSVYDYTNATQNAIYRNNSKNARQPGVQGVAGGAPRQRVMARTIRYDDQDRGEPIRLLSGKRDR